MLRSCWLRGCSFVLPLSSLACVGPGLPGHDEAAELDTSEAASATSMGSEGGDTTLTTATTTTTGTTSGTPTSSESGSGCQSDAECAPGNCIEGECVVCSTDDECWGVIPCEDVATCKAGTCVTDVEPCAIDACHQSWCDDRVGSVGVCRYTLCEEFDDVVDVELRIVASDFTISPKLDVGGEIRVLGLDTCGAVVIVRDVASDELLLFSSSGESPNPTWEWVREDLTTMANATWEQLLWPLLAVDYVDHGACPAIFDVCEYVDRASVDITHVEGGVARVLDGRLGWAPGGYLVSPHRLELMHFPTDCENYDVTNLDVLVARDACDSCPQPDFEPGCVDPLEPRPANFIGLEFMFIDYYRWDRWDFRCRVIDAWTEPGELVELEQLRALDCVALFQPDEAMVGEGLCGDD